MTIFKEKYLAIHKTENGLIATEVYDTPEGKLADKKQYVFRNIEELVEWLKSDGVEKL